MENNINRKLEIKRLLIFIILSFVFSWVMFGIALFSGFKWDGSNPSMENFVSLGMIMPFAAHVLTRIITREGFAMTGKDSMMLGIDLKNSKWKYYLFALFIPWLYYEVDYLLEWIIFPKSFDRNLAEQIGINREFSFFFPIIAISSAAIISFAALGEEGGWRGYMMPKLIKIIGLKRAIIVGGIIWGIWHAPLTCVGHNFGVSYAGFPYVGILFMCIMCTLIGIMLTFITIRTQSIWPAAIMHAVNNASPSILRFYINEDMISKKMNNTAFGWLFLMIPLALIDVILLKKLKENNRET